MCGIAGAVGRVSADVMAGVRRIDVAQKLRGPDASGEWSSCASTELISEGGAFFAHRRLKIIDLEDSANQPLIDPATRNAIIFNGEIYNFQELRLELSNEGVKFVTRSDTEVLLKAYGHWGETCLSKLKGMFAFAIWDQSRKLVFAARDRLGIKPLYYSKITEAGRSCVLVASQLRALLRSNLVDRRLNKQALSTYLWNGFVVAPDTLVEGVFQLLPGEAMRIDLEGNSDIYEYWRIPQSGRHGSVATLRSALEKSIEQHMISDVPVGVFLSGGVDSSAVATMASRISDEPVKTFTITFQEAEFNEAHYARRVASCIESDHHEVLLTEQTFTEQLDQALDSVDQPTFDGINSYFVSRAVKSAGLTVALAGTGGDELFGGYTSFRDLPWTRRWSQKLSFVPDALMRPIANVTSRVITGNFNALPPQTRWGRLADALAARGSMARLYQTANALFTSDFYTKLELEPASMEYGLPAGRLERFVKDTQGEPDLHAVSHLELSMFLGERLLRDTDAASMENSLEVRLPLIDHTVVEAAFSMSQEMRFKPVREKALLRKAAMWDLPDSVFDRPKLGFELPLDRWCRQGLKQEVGNVLTDPARCVSVNLNRSAVSQLWNAYQTEAPGLHWSRVWGIYVLLRWCEKNDVKA